MYYTEKLEMCKSDGVDIAQTLIFQALHDMYSFGEKRLYKINELLQTDIGKEGEGFILRWIETLRNTGMDLDELHKYSADITRAVTEGVIRGKEGKEAVRIIIAGGIICVFIVLYKEYGFREKRIKTVLSKLKQYARLIKKGEVTVWQFMECMYRECNVNSEALERYKEHITPEREKELKIYGELDQRIIKYDAQGKQIQG